MNNLKVLWAAWDAYVKSIPRKAWWLIGWCVLYSVIILTYTATHENTVKEVDDLMSMLQIPWIVIMSTPLWIKPLGNWVFRRGKYAKTTEEKK